MPCPGEYSICAREEYKLLLLAGVCSGCLCQIEVIDSVIQTFYYFVDMLLVILNITGSGLLMSQTIIVELSYFSLQLTKALICGLQWMLGFWSAE